jgi:hypothetical protein
MKTSTKLHIAAVAVSNLIAFNSVAAQPSDPAWLDHLNDQARLLEKCEIDYIVRFHEGELAGRKFFEARIKCADGRMFDATRIGTVDFFRFKACEETQVC